MEQKIVAAWRFYFASHLPRGDQMNAQEIRAASAAGHDRTLAVVAATVNKALRARERPSLRTAAGHRTLCAACRTAAVDVSGSIDIRPDGQDVLDAAALYQKCPACGAIVPVGDYRPAPPPTKTFRDPHLTPAAAHLRAAAAKTAEDASADAWTATSKAAKSGKSADFKKAASLHKSAADAQRQAAADDAASAATHASAAQQHDVQAAQHAADAAPDESDDDTEAANKSATLWRGLGWRRAPLAAPDPYARGLAARRAARAPSREEQLADNNQIRHLTRPANLKGYDAYGVPPDGYAVGLALRRATTEKKEDR
jgi:hypothetical protein